MIAAVDRLASAWQVAKNVVIDHLVNVATKRAREHAFDQISDENRICKAKVII